jgi:thiamine-monophosphate kinase
VHFRLDYVTLGQVIQKAITSNVSDIYAMGGAPIAFTLAAGLPAGSGEGDVASVIEGLRVGCETYGLHLAGGDTVFSPGGFFFDIAIIGTDAGREIIWREGAQPGDALVLFGECGGSLAGMHVLEELRGPDEHVGPKKGKRRMPARAVRKKVRRTAKQKRGKQGGGRLLENSIERETFISVLPELRLGTKRGDIERLCTERGLPDVAVEALSLVKQHLVPRATPLGTSLVESGIIHAMIDISDGLACDLRNVCRESGVGAVVDRDAVPMPAAVETLFVARALEIALASGEEYILLAAVDAGAAKSVGGAVIGHFTESGGQLILRGDDGSEKPLPEVGYEHKF